MKNKKSDEHQISSMIKRTEMAKKSYTFNDDGNPRVPKEYWFQETPEGLLLFLVFYTQACQYAKCSACNLPSKMSQKKIECIDIMKQVDAVFHNILSDDEKEKIKKIIISNNGSVLDENTFSTTALLYIAAKLNLECPNLTTVSIETRPEYVDVEELQILCRAFQELDPAAALELAIGFEAFDDTIRNQHFQKGLDLIKVENLLTKMSRVNQQFIKKFHNDFKSMKLKTYFMLKPIVGMSEEEAIQDICSGIDYLSDAANRYNIEINMHLNPTYVAKGTQLETEFLKGNYTPPSLESVKKVVQYAEGKNISIYVGLNDEGMAVPGGSFVRKGKGEKKLLQLLEKFNATHDFRVLK